MSGKKEEFGVEQSSFRMIYSVGRYVSRRFSTARPSQPQPDVGPPLAGTIGCYPALSRAQPDAGADSLTGGRNEPVAHGALPKQTGS